MFNLPTFLNKAGEWMLNLGAGFQKAIGAEGDTFQQRLGGVGQKILETGAKLQEAIGGTGATLPERIVGAAKTIVPAAAELAKGVAVEAPARAAGSLTLQAMGQKQFTPQTGVEKFFLGEEPVLSLGERIANAVPLGELIGQKVAGKIGGEVAGKIGGEVGGRLAPVVIVGLTALDLAPFGGTKKTLEETLLKTKTAEEAASLLTKAKVPQDLIETYAPKFAEATKIEDVKNGLKSLENTLKTTKPEVSAGVKAIPKELEPLAQEAKPFAVRSDQPTKGGALLGQFATREEAQSFLEKAKGQFKNAYIYGEAPVKGVANEFRVGDVIDIKGGSNMKSPIKIREITGNTIKFTDAEGTDFAGMQRPDLRRMIKEGTWEKVGTLEATKGIKEVKPEIKIPEEIKNINKAASKERGFITSVKETYPEMKVAGQYIPRSTDRLAIKAKNLIKDNVEEAEKIARTQTDDNAVAIGSELIKHYGDLAQEATNKATKAALNDRAAEIANDLARRLTAQGRSVQAASILGRLTPEGQVRFAAKEIQKYNEMVERTRGGILGLRRKIPELTGEQADHILTEMKAVQNMAEGEEKAMRFKKLQDYIQDIVPSPLYQKLISVWKAGLLTGIKTSGLNTFSNISHFGLETIKDLPASAIDSVASLLTGRKTLSFTLKGIPQGIKEGFTKGWTYLKTGYSERDFAFRWDYRKVNFGSGKLAKGIQKYEEGVFRVMGSEDMPFYYGAKAKSLYSQAIVQAKNKGLKGEEMRKFVENLVQNPTDEMVKYAVLDAETAVFQQETVLGKIARQIQKAPGGEIVVPFGKTPSAVATQILNYSPVGIAKTIFENVGKGKFDQRLFSQGLARGLTGTAILALGAYVAKKGLIETGRPTSEKEQKLWELEGRKANAIKVDGKWRDAQVLGPAGSLLVVGAYFQKELEKTGSATRALVQAAVGGAKSFTEQTFLKGMSATIDAITDPQRSAEGWFGSTLASTIPTIVSDVARATDIKERRVEGISERIKARIPGLRETLQPQVTVLGKEKERVGSFLEVMADPTRPSGEIQSPLIWELRRLWNNGYKVSPTLLGDKEGYKVLTPEQNTELWKRAGEITEQKLSNLIKSEKYQKLDDEQKAKAVEDFVDKSKLYARVEVVLKLTEGLEGDALIQKLKELKAGGLLTKQVFGEYQKLR